MSADPGPVLRYIRNPDVVLREEDEGSGLLFNPDTNKIRVLNSTGLFVWKLLDGDRVLSQLTATVRESFDDAPGDEVEDQIRKFIEEMATDGFVGTLEPERIG